MFEFRYETFLILLSMKNSIYTFINITSALQLFVNNHKVLQRQYAKLARFLHSCLYQFTK